MTNEQDIKNKVDDLHDLASSNAAKVNAIYEAMVGTVDGKTPGIQARLAAVEQSQDKRLKIEYAGATALIGLIIKAVWDSIVKG